MKERRASPRRTLPYVRSGVLRVAERNHIVAITDLSVEGAFLSARPQLPAGAPLRLALILPNVMREVSVDCELVWQSERFDPDSGRPAGLAVKFCGVEPEVQAALSAYTSRVFRPDPPERVEYRLLERPALDPEELTLLGQEGWELATTLPWPPGLKLVFLRRQ
ncbi:MAG TPA: PilZ domain-containing protein [Vicinamibacteria bacterium]|nr:PilZ domain-containing protein [Vicinamibacteria bacterium]